MTDPAGRLGPYLLHQPLGEGGMGVVWRAVHEPTGQVVALKTVRLMHHRQLDGIRREVRALSRVRHPGIVRILDQGVEDGAPWYAMELLEGTNLRQRARSLTATATTRFLLDTADHAPTRQTTLDLDSDQAGTSAPDLPEVPPTVRFPAANGKLSEVLSLARALCDPLGFLHGEGIVHRDLKPENVLVLEDGRVVIVDFGLVSQGAAGRDSLTIDAMLHGTASYMSPEQIRGELVDARGDLYALGVILYELVTGRRPFIGASVGTTLYQALQYVPLAPSARVTGVPPALDALILGLLAKRREDRPGFATDVAEVLEGLGADRPTGPAPRSRPYLYRPRFSGRDAALAELVARLEAGRGVVLIGGEPGAGKTRLALEFAREAASRGRTVLVGECLGDGGAGPLHPLRAALVTVADRCQQGASGTVERLLGERGRLLARYEPALAMVPEVAASQEPEPLDPEAERIRTLRWLTLTLQAVGHPAGAVVLLDDLDRADRLTIAWLAHVAAADIPGLLVVGTHGLDPGPEELDALRAAPGVDRLTLRSLDEAAVAALIGDMLAWHPVPAELAAWLVASSAGNPFLVAETLRAAVAAGALTRRAQRWELSVAPDTGTTWASLDVPVRLEDLVRARLGRLGPTAVATARAAAVLGREVDLDRALRVADLDADTPGALDALSELVGLGLVEADGGAYRFTHERVREAIERDLGPTERQGLHARAAQLAESDPDADPGRIGRHWLEAGRPDRAATWIGLAARRALDQAAPADAEAPLRAWLALDATDPDQRLEARILLGSRVFAALGRHAEAHEALEAARDEAVARGNRSAYADATSALGDVAAAVGRLADALALHEEALAVRTELGAPGPRARALLRVAAGLAATGRADETAPLVSSALDLAREAGDPTLQGEAWLADASGRPPAEARGRLLAAQALFRGVGNRLHQARVLERLAGLERGERARALYEEALDLYQQVGDRVRAGRVLTRLARAEHDDGRSGASFARSAEALAIFREAGHHRFQGHALLELGRHLRLDGRLAEADGLLRQAGTLLNVVGDLPWLARVQLELARNALARGAADAAVRHAGRAHERSVALENAAWAVEAQHLAGLAHERAGDRSAARAAHEAAQRDALTAGRPDLAARAQVWLVRADRLDGAPAQALDERLAVALAALAAPEHHAARAVAWCERGLLAHAMHASSDEAWMNAQDAHHEPLRMDPMVAEHLAELQAARAAQ